MADALILSAFFKASFWSKLAFIASLRCPLQSWSINEVGTATSRPVTAWIGDMPILLHSLFFAPKQAEATILRSSMPRTCWAVIVRIIISFTTAPCRSTWPCRHFAPAGTTSCLKSKMRLIFCTTSSYSFPPSVWNTSGGPKMAHHLSWSSSAVVVALGCLLTIPTWYSVSPSNKCVTL